jgi:hypothetical protein
VRGFEKKYTPKKTGLNGRQSMPATTGQLTGSREIKLSTYTNAHQIGKIERV